MMKQLRVYGAIVILAACQEPGSGEAGPPATPAALAAAPTAPAPAPITSSSAAPAGAPSPEPKEVALPTTPDAIKVPGAVAPFLKVHAKGVQIYACTPKKEAPKQFEWTLEGPEADLSDETGKVVGKHFAGPTWEATDGSKVSGALKAKVDAPNSSGVPWLLLEAKTNAGQGVFAHVAFIQRVDTEGGKAPAQGCDQAHAQAKVRVEYAANYYFYRASEPAPVAAPASNTAPAERASGKRSPCTLGADQTCNDDPKVSALWGRCTELGVCECKPGFVLTPGGRCRPK